MYLPTYSFIQRKNRVRTTTFGFGLCSVLYGVRFGSVRVLAYFYFRVSVLGKTWVLVRFVLAGFGFFLISRPKTPAPLQNSKGKPLSGGVKYMG